MSKFSLARQPYYIAVAIFCGFGAFVALGQDISTSDPIKSDLYLGLLVAFVILAAWSIWYLLAVQHGDDDEVGVEIAGLPAGKGLYYGAVLAACAYRAIMGYQANHTAGVETVWGIVWIIASLGVGLFTWGNWKSYQAKSTQSSFSTKTR